MKSSHIKFCFDTLSLQTFLNSQTTKSAQSIEPENTGMITVYSAHIQDYKCSDGARAMDVTYRPQKSAAAGVPGSNNAHNMRLQEVSEEAMGEVAILIARRRVKAEEPHAAVEAPQGEGLADTTTRTKTKIFLTETNPIELLRCLQWHCLLNSKT